MTENGTNFAEAFLLRDRIIQTQTQLITAQATDERNAVLAEQNQAIRSLLDIKAMNGLPFDLKVQVAVDDTWESHLHEFSMPMVHLISRGQNNDRPFIVFTRLTNLGKDGENSLGILESIGTYHILGVANDVNFLERTTEELTAIDIARNAIPQGSDTNRRKELRLLKDSLVIERLLSFKAKGNLPIYTSIKVDGVDGAIIVRVCKLGKVIGQFEIEPPMPGKYSDERNQKLTELLKELGLV